MSAKPVVLYVDDEPKNLLVFEANAPEDWEVLTFHSAMEALNEIDRLRPWVVLSDQRMPGMDGLSFLQQVANVSPASVRIVVSGYTEQATVISFIKKANVFDYITKPWSDEELEVSIRRGIELFSTRMARDNAFLSLEKLVLELEIAKSKLEESLNREKLVRVELEEWLPTPLIHAVSSGLLEKPVRRNFIAIVMDIISSSTLHSVYVGGVSVRSHVISLFTGSLEEFGGIRESHSGDSAYGHYGVFEEIPDAHISALRTSERFLEELASFNSLNGLEVRCGIAIHIVESALVNIHRLSIPTEGGTRVRKTFDTQAPDVDLLHRIEKIAHSMPGSNLLVSSAFAALMSTPGCISSVDCLGEFHLKGQENPVIIFKVVR
jgi:CheY-like chemotaxis protein